MEWTYVQSKSSYDQSDRPVTVQVNDLYGSYYPSGRVWGGNSLFSNSSTFNLVDGMVFKIEIIGNTCNTYVDCVLKGSKSNLNLASTKYAGHWTNNNLVQKVKNIKIKAL